MSRESVYLGLFNRLITGLVQAQSCVLATVVPGDLVMIPLVDFQDVDSWGLPLIGGAATSPADGLVNVKFNIMCSELG